jgi:hypothetical protein
VRLFNEIDWWVHAFHEDGTLDLVGRHVRKHLTRSSPYLELKMLGLGTKSQKVRPDPIPNRPATGQDGIENQISLFHPVPFLRDEIRFLISKSCKARPVPKLTLF